MLSIFATVLYSVAIQPDQQLSTAARMSTKNGGGLKHIILETANANNATRTASPPTCAPPLNLAHPSARFPYLGTQPIRTDDDKEKSRLMRELWDTRREIADAQVRQSALSNSLLAHGVDVPGSLRVPVQDESDIVRGRTFPLPLFSSPSYFET
jgi:hypothetical protein